MDVGRDDPQFPPFLPVHGLGPVLNDMADDFPAAGKLFSEFGEDGEERFSEAGFFNKIDAAEHPQVLVQKLAFFFFHRADVQKDDLRLAVFPANADFVTRVARNADLQAFAAGAGNVGV